MLVVHIDADRGTVENRHQQLEKQLDTHLLDPRSPDESIALVVPRYETETWLHHFHGRENVVETESYNKFDNKEATAAQPTVLALIDLVDGKTAAPNNLPSLLMAVSELRRLP